MQNCFVFFFRLNNGRSIDAHFSHKRTEKKWFRLKNNMIFGKYLPRPFRRLCMMKTKSNSLLRYENTYEDLNSN